MSAPSITYRDPVEGELEQCWAGLRAHNAAFVTNDFVPYTRVAVTAAGAVVGGIKGVSYWHKLHIADLWVSPTVRHQRIGTTLMTHAETEAIRRGCSGIILDTMSFHFQALAFYERLGYAVFGTVPGYAGGAVRHYLQRRCSRRRRGRPRRRPRGETGRPRRRTRPVGMGTWPRGRDGGLEEHPRAVSGTVPHRRAPRAGQRARGGAARPRARRLPGRAPSGYLKVSS